MFTVRGQSKKDPSGLPRTISWDNGQLLGDDETCLDVYLDALASVDRPTGPQGGPYYTGPNPLSNDLASAYLINEQFVPGTMVAFGEVPERPPIPEGAIG